MVMQRRPPRKYRLRYYSRRRNYRKNAILKRRRYNRKRTYTKMFKSPGFPDRMLVKMNYVEIAQPGLGDNTNLYQGITFQNSLFDPNASGVGHQPLWFDQWANVYTNYRVKGWSYKITVENLSNVTGWAGIRHQDIGSGENNKETFMERKDSRWVVLGPIGSSRSIHYFKGYLDVAKTVGQTRLDVNTDDQYMASWNANPTKKCWLATYMAGGTSSTPFRWTCKLTYYAELSGRLSPGGS